MTSAHRATSNRSKPAASLDDLQGAHGHLRIGIAGTSGKPRSIQLVNQVLGVLRTLEASGSKLVLIEEMPSRLTKVTLPWRWTLRLRSCDFPGLSGWPIGEPPLPLICNLHPRMLPPPALAETDRLFARANAPGRDELVGIPIRDSLFHTHLLGPTGSGKSTVLHNLILADIAAGRGTLVIAPKGDLVSDILELIPRNLHDDVVILDPTSLTPVGFNALDCPPSQAHVAADSLLSTFEALIKENWGIRTADVLSAALLTLARHPEANLLWLEPLLTTPAFRKKVLRSSDDPLGVDNFWQRYDHLEPERQSQEIAPVLNKLRQIILRPGLRAMLGQTNPKFSIDKLLSQNKFVLLSLNRGRVGSEAARLLGSLVMSHLWTRILARQALPAHKRKIVPVYIDEVHDFLAGIPGDLANALAQVAHSASASSWRTSISINSPLPCRQRSTPIPGPRFTSDSAGMMRRRSPDVPPDSNRRTSSCLLRTPPTSISWKTVRARTCSLPQPCHPDGPSRTVENSTSPLMLATASALKRLTTDP